MTWMAREKAPAFQFYVKDWRSSRHVQNMDFATRGMYLEMLLQQWEAHGVPATPAACAALLGGTTAAWTRAWEKLRPCFTVDGRKTDGLLVNLRLEAVRRAAKKYRKTQSDNGKRGATARWTSNGGAMASPSERNGDSMANDGSASASASASSSSSSSAPASTGNTRLPQTGRKRPIFTGQRLTVFDWQLDGLRRLLGSHTDSFDLPAWFQQLDAHAVASDCVIPQRDGGAWLQGQTLAEAQRRGLPIAVSAAATPAGKQTTRLLAGVANIERQEARR